MRHETNKYLKIIGIPCQIMQINEQEIELDENGEVFIDLTDFLSDVKVENNEKVIEKTYVGYLKYLKSLNLSIEQTKLLYEILENGKSIVVSRVTDLLGIEKAIAKEILLMGVKCGVLAIGHNYTYRIIIEWRSGVVID